MREQDASAAEFFRAVFDVSPIALSVFNASHELVDCNGALLSMFGVTKEYYLAHYEDFSPEYQADGTRSAEKAASIFGRAVAGESFKTEWMHCTEDGDPVPCEVTLTRVRQGERYAVLAFSYDLRDIRRVEDELAEAERLSKAVTEADPSAYILFDEDLKPVDCNGSALSLFESPSKKHLLEHYWKRLTPKTQPDGQSSREKNKLLRSRALAEGRCVFEWKHLTHKRRPLYTKTTMTPILYNGKNYIASFNHDLRGIKEMEAALNEAEELARLMIDSAPICCQLWDKNLNIIDCNHAALTLYGFATRDEFIRRWQECSPYYQPCGRVSREMGAEYVIRAFAGENVAFEWMHQLPDGTPVPAEITLARVEYKGGYIVAGYTRDLREHKRMMGEIEQQTNLLQTVNQVSAVMLGSNAAAFERDLLASLDIIAKSVDADRAYICENYSEGDKLYYVELYEWRGGAEQVRPAAGERVFREMPPEWETALSAGYCVNGAVSGMSEREKALLAPGGALSALIVPIILKGRLRGFMGFDDYKKERAFSGKEEMILRSAGSLIANALTRNEEENRARRAEERVHLMLDATPLGCELWDKNLRIIDCNNAAAALFGLRDKEEFIGRFAELSPEFQPNNLRSDSLFEILVKRAFADGRVSFEWMHQKPGGEPVPVDLTLVRVEYDSDYVVVAYMRDLRDIKTLEEIAEEANYDALTGIRNRRYLDKELNNVIKFISRQPGSRLSLMMLDIDRFKQYNDTYGHSEGDICLKKVAAILQECVTREQDFVVRYGGEEFTMVLPHTDEHGARMLAEKVLRNVKNARIVHETSDVDEHVTISIGVTTGFVTHDQDGSHYIRRADELLYTSKKNGRNRYTFAPLHEDRR
ncbi:MAG: diguanylate cyclase [Oscillospiraceae bacterium]|jgi:diguanylate cyclase (GGDEF)-like protein/PAS domain S-box-containing protein|nr:diguanylate cyclase [Oscillospiraceae bacterium]